MSNSEDKTYIYKLNEGLQHSLRITRNFFFAVLDRLITIAILIKRFRITHEK